MNIKFFYSNKKDEIQIDWNFENSAPSKGDKILIDDEKLIEIKDVVWNTKTNEVLVYTSYNKNPGQYCIDIL